MSLIYTRDDILTRGQVRAAAVYHKPAWGDLWLFDDRIYCESLQHTSGGAIGKAEMVRDFGRIHEIRRGQTGSSGWESRAEVNLQNYWVRIDYEPVRLEAADPDTAFPNAAEGTTALNTTSGLVERKVGPSFVTATDLKRIYSWYGVIKSQDTAYMGSDPEVSGSVRYTALSLEYLLSLKLVTESWVEDRPGDPAQPRTIKTGIPFNGGAPGRRSSGQNLTKNMGPQITGALGSTGEPTNRPVHAFASGLKQSGTNEANAWTLNRCLDYLMKVHDPTPGANINWQISTSADVNAFLSTQAPPATPTDAKTLLDMLKALIDRRRGLTWAINVDENPSPPETMPRIDIVIETYTAADITLPSGGFKLPANANQYFVDWSHTRDTENTKHAIADTAKTYNSVRVLGDFQGAVFTGEMLDVGGGTDVVFEPGWSSAQENLYQLGASGESDYPPVEDRSIRQSRNATVRRSPELRETYTRWRVKRDWDGVCSASHQGSTGVVFPDMSGLAWNATPVKTTPSVELWHGGMRIQTTMPLRTGWDYSVDPPTSGGGSDEQDPFRTLDVYLPRDNQALPGGYYDSHNPASTYDETILSGLPDGSSGATRGARGGVNFTCSSQPLTDEWGVSVLPSGDSHTIGKWADKFDGGAGGNDHPVSTLRNNISSFEHALVTCYAQCHSRIEHTETSAVPIVNMHDSPGVLEIFLGERARLDWLIPETVIGINSKGFAPSAPAGNGTRSPDVYVALRDDRKLLVDIATTALAWYGKVRQSLNIHHRQNLVGDYLVGSIITTVTIGATPAHNLVGQDGNNIVGQDGNNIVGQSSMISRPVNSLITSVRHNFRDQSTQVTTEFTELDFISLAGVA